MLALIFDMTFVVAYFSFYLLCKLFLQEYLKIFTGLRFQACMYEEIFHIML